MDLIIISDLHLSTGCDENTGEYSRNEDFFFDEEFKRFLEYLQKVNHSNNHLVIAGDLFDFLQVDGDKVRELFKVEMAQKLMEEKEKKLYKQWEGKFLNEITRKEKKYGLGTEADKTEWKLETIVKGHPVFFNALANFLTKENKLSIITGNHDIELYWPEVQNALKEKIVEKMEDLKVDKQKIKKEQIKFYPWFYYDEEHKTYIEHGNQYDSLNSFQYFLYPVLGRDTERVWLPFGSLFVRYFFNKLETSNPFADNIKPITRYVEWVWNEQKLELIKVIWRNLPMMFFMFFKRRKFSEAEEIELNKQNEIGYKKCSEEFNLKLNAVKKIYRLRTLPFTKRRLSTISFFLGTIFFLFALITFIIFFVLHIYDIIPPLALLSPIGLLLVPIVKWLYNKYFRKSFFEKNKTKIEKIKHNLGDVKTIVFGHTHEPEIRKINENCWYFNTGTWTTVVSEEERIIREAKQFAFVRIKDCGKKPELLRWNDCRKEEERLILFEPKSKKSDKK